VARPSRSSTFIDEGLLARHLRKMRRIYAKRHDLILRTLVTDFSDWLRPIPAVTGIHVAATLRSGSRAYERDLAAIAAANDVAFDRLSGYWASGRGAAGNRARVRGIAIAEGLSRLGRCFEGRARLGAAS
jgi:GntR family transcriptional regulator/MocR family aminotransferase